MKRRTVGILAGVLGVVAGATAVIPILGPGTASAATEITTPNGTYRAGAPTTTVGIQPQVSAGNVNSCSDVGAFDLELNVLNGGWFSEGETTVSVGNRYVRVYDNDGFSFNWESNADIGVVIVKSSAAYNSYAYDSGVRADTALHGPERYNEQQDRWQPTAISHAIFCSNDSGGPSDPLPPSVNNSVAGTYDTTYEWTVGKSATPAEVTEPVGTEVTAAYSVIYTRGEPTYSNGTVIGTATVTNPNEVSVLLSDITATLSDGTTCTVTSPSLTLSPGENLYDYECTLTTVPPAGPLSHIVTIAWEDQTLSDGTFLQAGTAKFSDGGIEFTSNDIDECVAVSDTYGDSPVSGTICASTTYEYPRSIVSKPGCFTYNNTADFVTNDTGSTGSGSASVEVCGPQDLIVSKTATPSYTRTYGWTIDKEPDTPRQSTSDEADVTWTVGVTKDGGTDSAFAVAGEITVYNPNDFDMSGVQVSDTTPSGDCAIDGASEITVPAGASAVLDYLCTFAANPGSGTNTADASWDQAEYGTENGSASGTADFVFGEPTTVVNGSIHVTDSTGASWTFDATGSTSYTVTYDDPAGTCTDHSNTATIEETGQSATAESTVCVGADLTVSKTAGTEYTRTYGWDIAKTANPLVIKQVGGTATFDYTVLGSQTGFTDSGWAVTGSITVTNPNDWEAIDADLTDSLADCVLTQSSFEVPASGSVTVLYRCPLSSAENGTNTATADWDASTYYTPSGTASGSASYVFGEPTTTVNRTVTFTDTFNGSGTTLGTLTATDGAPYATATYTYQQTVSVPTWDCRTYDNTATIVETGQSGSASVKVCGPARTGALTMGFWQNKNGQSIITTYCNGTSGTTLFAYLTGYNPFRDLSRTACGDIAAYVFNIIKTANASGASMNAMLKAQMLATALDVYFSDPSLGGNRIAAPSALGSVQVDLTKVCKNIAGGCTLFENTSTAFGGVASMTVSGLLAYAAGQSNAGGITWYGNVKTMQELAKDTFDAINNQRVFTA